MLRMLFILIGPVSIPTASGVPRVWPACLFSHWIRFSRKKIVLALGRSETRLCRRPPTFSLYYEGKAKETIFPEISCKKNNSPQGKFHRFLFPFSSKFPDLNFASYVFSIFTHVAKPVRDTLTVRLGFFTIYRKNRSVDSYSKWTHQIPNGNFHYFPEDRIKGNPSQKAWN